jgi:hypothetical protein
MTPFAQVSKTATRRVRLQEVLQGGLVYETKCCIVLEVELGSGFVGGHGAQQIVQGPRQRRGEVQDSRVVKFMHVIYKSLFVEPQ